MESTRSTEKFHLEQQRRKIVCERLFFFVFFLFDEQLVMDTQTRAEIVYTHLSRLARNSTVLHANPRMFKERSRTFSPVVLLYREIPSSDLGCLSNYANNNFITTQLHSVHSWEAYNGFCLFKWAHTMMRRECLAAKITKIISIRVCALELAWWQLKSRVDPVMAFTRVRSLGRGTVIHWWAIHEQSHKSRLVRLNGGSLLSPHIRSQFKFDTFSSKYLQHVLVPAFVFVFSRVIGTRAH